MIGGWENEGKFENPSLKIEETELRGGWFIIIIIIFLMLKAELNLGLLFLVKWALYDTGLPDPFGPWALNSNFIVRPMGPTPLPKTGI